MHHLNLVRLWGFYAEKGQRVLVYEHIPGGSLDKYLFRVNKYHNNNNLKEQSSFVVRSEEWYFPGWAFDKMFKKMRGEEILDGQIRDAYDSRAHFKMVNRMVKTAMWCLQDRPELRPTMGKVAKMLEGTVEITEPKKPTVFFLGEE
ncbi:hypothetical protein JHK82_048094 [Glycine max]|nr:hypothetical protein JHK86_047970 [Glycine max]KAG5098240.1 hypothetical protein JHK82_048094 [Glycine max]KAG5103026.1 hypothetical protein JHK84_047995 [Glycine max]